MRPWLETLQSTARKKPLPILSFPAAELLGVTVRELISDSELQARGMQAVAGRTDAAAAVSLMDLMFTAKDQIGLYYKTTECLTLLVAAYLIIILPLSLLGRIWERRLRHAGFGA
jgi:hypothetical protein